MKLGNKKNLDRYPFDDLKRLTIVISKLIKSSYTEEQNDNEKANFYFNEFRDLSLEIVEGYGGILQSKDDKTIVSIFGVYSMREDDSILAVKAAREIHKMADLLANKHELPSKRDYTVKTYIDSEFTSLSNYEKSDQSFDSFQTLMNNALSLCKYANEWDVIVGHNIYNSVSRYYQLEEIDLESAKDKKRFFRVISEKSRPQRIHRTIGFRSEFIGRIDELNLLKNGVEELKRENGGIIEVIGEAGVGKTRLINEFINYVDLSEVCLIEGYCFSYFINYPFILFSNLISEIFSISEQDSKDTIKSKIETLTNKIVDNPDEVIPYISSLYAIKYDKLEGMDPASFKLNFFESIYKLLIAYSKEKPLVIVFDDLQWADLSSIDLLRYLFSEIEDLSSILFICTYRSDFSMFTVRQSLNRDVKNKQINLKQLPSEESKRMLESILKKEQLPQKLVKLVITTGEGNPFYIEEIVNSLVESGTLFKKGEDWVVSKQISSYVKSMDLTELVLSRLDQLDIGSKQVLCEASVIGRLFKSSVLKNITSMPEKVDDLLKHLEFSDFIQSVGFEEDEEFIFKHTIIHDIAYNLIHVETRQFLHRQIGKHYEDYYSENIELHLDLITYHYSKSDDYNKAIYFCVMAGEKSYSNASLYEAGKYYLKAVEFIKNSSESATLEDTLLVSLHRIFDCFKMTDPTIVFEHLKIMLSIYEKRQDTFNTLLTKGLMISMYAGSNHWEDGKKLGEELISSQESDPVIWAILMIATSMCMLSLGELEKLFDYSVKSIEVAKEVNPLMLGSAYLCAYASSSWMGDVSTALNYSNLSIELCKKNKQLIDMEAFSHLYQGFVYLSQGKYTLANKSLNKSKEIEERLGGGYYYIASFRYFVSGLLYYALGDWENLKIEADELVNMQKYINGSLLHFAEIYYGCIEAEKGNNTIALQHIIKAVNEFEKIKYGIVLPRAYRFLGELYMKMEKTDLAFEVIHDGLLWAERTNQKTEIIACKCNKALLLAQREDWDSAKNELDTSDIISKELTLVPSMANVTEAWGMFYTMKAHKIPKERPALLEQAREYYSRSIEFWKSIGNTHQVERIRKELEKIK